MFYLPDTHFMKLTDPARVRIAGEVAVIYGLDELDEEDCASIFQQLEIAALEVWPLMNDDGTSVATVSVYSITGGRDENIIEAAFADFLIVKR